MLTQVVDFPTPPFPLATAKTRAHEAREGAVSYTHLTLPTILLV